MKKNKKNKNRVKTNESQEINVTLNENVVAGIPTKKDNAYRLSLLLAISGLPIACVLAYLIASNPESETATSELSSIEDFLKNQLLALKKIYPYDNLQRILEEALIGIIVGLAEMPLAFVLQYITTAFTNPKFFDHLEGLNQVQDLIPDSAAETVVGGLLYPPVEEAFFRGGVTPFINLVLGKIGMGKWIANKISVGASSLFFGVSHSIETSVQATTGSLIYEYLTARHHGSLWSSTAAHITHNLAAPSIEKKLNVYGELRKYSTKP